MLYQGRFYFEKEQPVCLITVAITQRIISNLFSDGGFRTVLFASPKKYRRMSKCCKISPMVWIAIFILAGNAFFMAYQNMWAVMSRSIAEDRAWTNQHQGIYGLLYFVACLLAILTAIPMWINAGLFG